MENKKTRGKRQKPRLPEHLPVESREELLPQAFVDHPEQWKRIGEEEYGFKHVESGPLVRSSYHAKEQARELEAGGPGAIQNVMEADIPAPAEVRLDLVQLELGRPGRALKGA